MTPRPRSDSPHPPPEIATRDRLLDTAERFFAERGFGGTSVRELTSCAECNVAAVNYHFGGKAGLYEAVFRRRLTMLRERRVGPIRSLMEREEPPELEELLRTFITAFVEPLLERSGGRTIMQLIVREILDPHLPRQLLIDEMFEPVQAAMVGAMCRVTPGLEPVDALRCLHSIVGQVIHTVHTCQVFDTSSERFRPLGLGPMADHIVRFSVAGIEASRTGLPGDSP